MLQNHVAKACSKIIKQKHVAKACSKIKHACQSTSVDLTELIMLCNSYIYTIVHLHISQS